MNHNQALAARVTGEWLPDDHPGYPALVSRWWNGWAVPWFTKPVLDWIMDDQRDLVGEDDYSFRWKGQTLVATIDGEDYEILPTTQAGVVLYEHDIGWTWDLVADSAIHLHKAPGYTGTWEVPASIVVNLADGAVTEMSVYPLGAGDGYFGEGASEVSHKSGPTLVDKDRFWELASNHLASNPLVEWRE